MKSCNGLPYSDENKLQLPAVILMTRKNIMQSKKMQHEEHTQCDFMSVMSKNRESEIISFADGNTVKV